MTRRLKEAEVSHDLESAVVVRYKTYSQEQMELTMHDPLLDDAALIEKVLVAARRLRLDCQVTRWCPDEPRAVVGVAIGFEPTMCEPDVDLKDFLRVAALASGMIEVVEPATAFATVHGLAGHLPEDDWDKCGAWEVGYVRRDTLTGATLAAFDGLVTDGLGFELHGGIAWPPGGLLDSESRPRPDGDAGRRAYSAWTRRAAPRPWVEPEHPVEVVEPQNFTLPVLWVYDPRRSVTRLERQVRRLLPKDFSVWIDDGVTGWPFVQVLPPEELTDQDVLLERLRTVARLVRPAFVGLLPRRGFLLPGVEPAHPVTGMIDHVWVDDAWIGSRRDDLHEALGPVVPERVGDGELFVTHTEVRVPGGATNPYGSHDGLMDHLTAAAGVLGEVAVAYRRSAGPLE